MNQSQQKKKPREKRILVTPELCQKQMELCDKRIAELQAVVDEQSRCDSKNTSRQTLKGEKECESPSAKKLNHEQCERMVDRLTRQRLRKEDLPPIPGFVTHSIDAAGIQALVDRLGNAPSRDFPEFERDTVKIEPEQLEAMAVRLTKETIEKKNKFVEKLRAKILEPVTAYQKSYDNDTIQQVTNRLFYKWGETRVKTKEKLKEKYVDSTELPKKQISREQLKQMADRLSKQTR